MSDFRAIAGVSRTLKRLLLDRMSETPVVTIAPPDVKVDGVTGKWLNIYLYHMAENGYLKNQEIPSHGHPGSYGHPPLSLDLHYLLTAFPAKETGETADLEAQEVLGDAMRILHDFPIITETSILDTTLLNEFERVKITLQPASMEELSKIWTALPGANFRRSSAYVVSVVQIESTRPKRIALPVKTRRIHVSTLMRPEITDVYRTPSTGEPSGDTRAAIGQEITIEGNNFIAPRTWVRLGGLEPIGISPIANNKITITIPDDQYPIDPDHPAVRDIPEKDRLQPGPHVVEVLIRRDTEVVQGGLDKGTVVPEQTKQGSNLSVFMLVPSVASTNPAGTIPGAVPLEDVAPVLEAAIRGSVLANPLFNDVFVFSVDNRLIILPGGNSSINQISFTDAPGDTTATELLLTAGTINLTATISGSHATDPDIISTTPKVKVTINGTTKTVTLSFQAGTIPGKVPLNVLAPVLESAIRSVPGNPLFNDGMVFAAANRLVVLPGGNTTANQVSFANAAGDTTATKLLLTASTMNLTATVSGGHASDPDITSATPKVKVRINGSEAFGDLIFSVLSVKGKRLYPKGKKCVVIIGDISIDIFTPGLNDHWSSPTTTKVQVPLDKFFTTTSSLSPGNYEYPIRVMVNGAQSVDEKIYKYTKT